jgi:hypothetical protein
LVVWYSKKTINSFNTAPHYVVSALLLKFLCHFQNFLLSGFWEHYFKISACKDFIKD